MKLFNLKAKILFVGLLLLSNSLSAKEIYFYTNDIFGFVGKIRIYNGDNNIAEIGKNQHLSIQAEGSSKFSFTLKWGLRLNKKIDIDLTNKEVAFIYIHLSADVWSVHERYYPNIPDAVKHTYEHNKNQKLISKRVGEHPNTGYTKNSLKQYLENSTGINEGLYENTIKSTNFPNVEIGIIKNEEGYTLIYISGGDDSIWKEGDVKAYLTKSGNSNLYKAIWYLNNKEVVETPYVSFDNEVMKVIGLPSDYESIFLKTYPVGSKGVSNVASSGTGFAIADNGLIVTNYHVIEGAGSITVKGVNGNFTSPYKAKVLLSDKANDLAILQINDVNFKGISKIPYTIKQNTSDVGESVFGLGYPLKSTMGDELKLTNGIISSKTGFQGEINSYQVSASVQSGNSGGPLFDKSGNLIGIINAKNGMAENASYAIKVSYLRNIIDMLPTSPNLNNNTLQNLSLAEQVKILNEFVYIIETM